MRYQDMIYPRNEYIHDVVVLWCLQVIVIFNSWNYLLHSYGLQFWVLSFSNLKRIPENSTYG